MGRRGVAEERRTEFGIRQQDRRRNTERGTGGGVAEKKSGKGKGLAGGEAGKGGTGEKVTWRTRTREARQR